jgi:hypothetical protein
MDAEQIRGEMRQTRASIDRKFDILAAELSTARQQALRAAAMIFAAAVAVISLWSWQRHHSAVKVRMDRYGKPL